MARKDALLRLHKTLLARRDDLRKKLSSELETLGGNPSAPAGDSADVAFDAGSDEMTSQLAEFDARELTQIERALARLKQGVYGICEMCSQKIPVGRLNALPYTSMCIDCQREIEKYPSWDYRRDDNWENVSDSGFDEPKEIRLSDLEMDVSPG